MGTPAIPAWTRSRVESAGLFAAHPVQIQHFLRAERFARKIRRKRTAFLARARQSNRGHRTRDGFKRIYNSLRRQLPQRITRRRARLSTCFMTHGTMPPVQCSAILCEYHGRHEKQTDQEKNESMRHNTSGSTGEMNHNSLIEFECISVMRGPTLALDNVSLKIGVGEHFAILGPNGCGKSTLIKTITRECYPLFAEGSSVRILGQETWNILELRALLGIVSTDLMMTCTREISGRDIVLSGFFSSIGIWPHQDVTAEMVDRAERAMATLEGSHIAGRFTNEMSTG